MLPAAEDRPWVSMLVIAYRQADTVGEAIAGALAQTWQPLEIIVSDDASGDGTWAAIERAVAGYAGPHRLVLNRNPRNLGIGAHLSHLASIARGELLFVAAGDDVSLPERCQRVTEAWLARGRRPDLIAGRLVDIDTAGQVQGELRPSQLADWRSADDWLARPPYVVGAAQAWTRRLFDRFGPLPPGTVAEDLVMVFRAIVSGGAITLDDALVRYRRGGLSGRRRALDAASVSTRMLRTARHTLVELGQVLADARVAGVEPTVARALAPKIARETHVAAQLGEDATTASRWRRLLGDHTVPWAVRLRVFVYAACPGLLAPFFALKRWTVRRRATRA
jgi:glycosyltransferase involved in cell wall biosynthesis